MSFETNAYAPTGEGTGTFLPGFELTDGDLNQAFADARTDAGRQILATAALRDLSNVTPSAVGAHAIFPVFNVQLYGAMGDGLTDDTAACQAAINAAQALGVGAIVYFPPPPVYYRVTPQAGAYANPVALLVTSSRIIIEGAGSEISQVLTNSGTGDVLYLRGAPGSYLSHNGILGMTFGRTGLPTIGANTQSVRTEYCVWLNIYDVIGYNSTVCWSFTNVKSMTIEKTEALRTGDSQGAGDTYTGFQVRGSCYTSRFNGCVSLANATDSSTPYSGGGLGFDIAPTDARDLWFRECQSDLITTAYSLDGSNLPVAGDGNQQFNFDIRFTDCTADSFGSVGFKIFRFTGYATITIHGGWVNPGTVGAATFGITTDLVANIGISGVEFLGAGNTNNHTGILVTRGTLHTISDNIFTAVGNPIQLNGATGASPFCNTITVSGNTVNNTNPTYPTTDAFKCVSATGVSFTGNAISGSYAGAITRAFNFDAASGNNRVVANTINIAAVTTPLLNSFTGSPANRGGYNAGLADF